MRIYPDQSMAGSIPRRRALRNRGGIDVREGCRARPDWAPFEARIRSGRFRPGLALLDRSRCLVYRLWGGDACRMCLYLSNDIVNLGFTSESIGYVVEISRESHRRELRRGQRGSLSSSGSFQSPIF